MIYAVTENGRKDEATPGASARCPHCKAEVIPKCGEIKTWHWAHRDVEDCDHWGEPETDWHRSWKAQIPADRAEATIKRFGEEHRADITRPDGTVVELQHSSLSPEEIREREAFYGSMVWLFDIRAFSPPCEGDPRFIPKEKDGFHSFRWKHPRKHVAHTSKPTYLDMGPRIMRLKKIHTESPCGGWGRVKPRSEFMKWLAPVGERSR
jgi:competence protein CoiA